MSFEENGVACTLRMEIKEDVGKVMKMFMIGTLVKVKSRVGFRVRAHFLWWER